MTPEQRQELRLLVTNTGIVSALERQRQIDEDGVEVGVSREALHYAIMVVKAAPALLDAAENLDIETQMHLRDEAKSMALIIGLKDERDTLRAELQAARELNNRLTEIVERAAKAWLTVEDVAWHGDLADAMEAGVAALKAARERVEKHRSLWGQTDIQRNRAIGYLRQVGNDYPGSSCQQWCHEKADECAALKGEP